MNKYLAILIISVWSFIIYYNSLSGEFVFDDESVVQNNISIQSLSNIPKYFTADEGFHKVIGRYYRPIVSTSYAIDYSIWGLEPFGFHLSNIFFHIISSILLFLILKQLFSKYENPVFISFMGAMIFAVHTIHTEAVSWISGRTDSIVTLFFFASFLFYIKYPHKEKSKTSPYPLKRGTKFLVLSLVFYCLGLLSKEMIITMPVILFLYDYFYRKLDIKKILSNYEVYLYFIGLSLLYFVIRYLLLLDIPEREKYLYFYGMDFFAIFGTMLKTIPVYFKLLFLPVNLIYHYNGVISDVTSAADITFILSAVFIIALIVIGWLLRKSYGVLSFCIFFFLVSLIPVMNIIQTMNLMAERFLYMTSFIVSLSVCFVLYKTAGGKYFRKLTIVFSIIILLYSYLTFERNKDWQSNNALYSTGEGIDGTVLLVNAGNIYANNKNFDEAAKRYFRALEIRENNILANHNLGLVYLIKGNYDSAEYRLKKGINIDSLAPDGYFQLAVLYKTKGNIDEAIRNLEKLQTIDFNYRGSAELLMQLKMSKESGQVPDNNVLPNYELSSLQEQSYKLFQQNEFGKSIEILEKLIEKDSGGKAGYLNNMGLCYIGLENYDEAERAFDECLKIEPENVNGLSGKADVLRKKNKISEAIKIYKKVMKINPNPKTKAILDSLLKFY
ncbi:MAG: tetratricopeptide repeat protein [Ignavibacteria bacterium]|nr:tetratricopeptide repeat protein [Ignavibacteria bacterium]